MQAKATKQTPAPNAAERRFLAYTKESDCICCAHPGPSIVDHVWGRSKKLYNGLERVHVGHWAVVPLCMSCDNVKTRGSRRAFENEFGSQVDMWAKHAGEWADIPQNVWLAIIREPCNG